MKIENVRVSVAANLNIGNFNTARTEVSAEATLDDGEKVSDAIPKLAKFLRQQLDNELSILVADLKKQ